MHVVSILAFSLASLYVSELPVTFIGRFSFDDMVFQVGAFHVNYNAFVTSYKTQIHSDC